jgi:hypothetical protein
MHDLPRLTRIVFTLKPKSTSAAGFVAADAAEAVVDAGAGADAGAAAEEEEEEAEAEGALASAEEAEEEEEASVLGLPLLKDTIRVLALEEEEEEDDVLFLRSLAVSRSTLVVASAVDGAAVLLLAPFVPVASVFVGSAALAGSCQTET